MSEGRRSGQHPSDQGSSHMRVNSPDKAEVGKKTKKVCGPRTEPSSAICECWGIGQLGQGGGGWKPLFSRCSVRDISWSPPRFPYPVDLPRRRYATVGHCLLANTCMSPFPSPHDQSLAPLFVTEQGEKPNNPETRNKRSSFVGYLIFFSSQSKIIPHLHLEEGTEKQNILQ
jgi:hypothetical protein